MTNKNSSNWWAHSFDKNYLDSYVDISDISRATTLQQTEFLIKELRLKKTAKILDLACGHGRVSLEFARRGFLNVFGIDYSKFFIFLAKKEAKKNKLPVAFQQMDMRKINYRNTFDYIFNIFTSFGYFNTEAENIMIIKKMHRSLKKNGYMVMDLNNTLRTIIHFSKLGEVDKKTGVLSGKETEKLSNGLQVTTTYTFDSNTMRAQVIDTWKQGGETHERTSNIRAYVLPEITHLLEENGFCVKKVWGDFTGQPFDLKSPRMILLVQKK